LALNNLDSIVAAIVSKSPLLIAIDGGSGSGKSTLGAALAKKLNLALLSLDDYLIEASDAALDQRSPVQNFEQAFDLQAITRELAGRKQRREAVVIEGVYSHRPLWRDSIDFRIWIDMDKGRRLQSMQARGANSASQMRLWQATEDWYIQAFNPAAGADLIVQATHI
jgi:para-aminobenzoate synthetase